MEKKNQRVKSFEGIGQPILFLLFRKQCAQALWITIEKNRDF